MSRQLICGVDEAGRGALAGPVVAAAAVCHPNVIAGLNDSKKISNRQRRALIPVIRTRCVAFALGVADVCEVDEHNIRQATALAMQRAVSGICVPFKHVLVDGDFVPELEQAAYALPHGDTLCENIMIASILAKVTRDDMLITLDTRYPHYGFKQHKGYGTAMHMRALAQHGPCPEHRRSFAPVKRALRSDMHKSQAFSATDKSA